MPPEVGGTAGSKQSGYRLAIVNPLTLAGKEVQSILHERGIAYREVALVATAEDETGSVTELFDEAAYVQPAANETLSGFDVVFFCGPAEVNQPWIEKREDLGFIAVDLSVPSAGSSPSLFVAGVNDGQLKKETNLITCPHPIATPLILLLAKLREVTSVELCAATVIQPASVFGQQGIDELLQQSINVLNIQGVSKEVFDRQLAFNLYPAVDGDRDRSTVVAQVNTVLDDLVPLALTIIQGTTFHSHSFSLFVQTRGETGVAEITAALSQAAGIRFADSAESLSTLDAAGQDQVLIDAIKADPEVDEGMWIWMVSDNLRRSSALNGVILAENLLQRFYPAAQ
ncbi:MAG: Asd/ArgC dimerization domain-containing protein [Acidobacteriota bacterium]